MKKVLSLLVVIALMICGIATVSAEISPGATVPDGYIKVDVIPYPEGTGDADCDEKGYIKIDSGEQVTITATAKPGYKFSHWEFITGQYTIVDGKITDSVMVIEPEGDQSLLIYAHFVEEGADVTEPTEKPSLPVDDDDKSPTTGETTNSAIYVASSVVVLLGAFVAVVALRKKQNG